MFNRILIATALTALLSVSVPAPAGELGIGIVFSDNEAKIIRAWYRDHGGDHVGYHSSKAKGRKSLPPGIAKNLQRGKPLPPGIAKQALPSALDELLGPPPRGYERLELAGRILLVEVATRVIHDVLEDLVLG
jgi:hypothetical protein